VAANEYLAVPTPVVSEATTPVFDIKLVIDVKLAEAIILP
jgi:hypothetical protein